MVILLSYLDGWVDLKRSAALMIKAFPRELGRWRRSEEAGYHYGYCPYEMGLIPYPI